MSQSLSQSLIPPVLAVVVVLTGATAFVDYSTSDQQMVASRSGREIARVCAKSRATCEAAIDAVRNGWIFVDLAIESADLWCEPARVGECFDARSNCIVGYNCPAGVR